MLDHPNHRLVFNPRYNLCGWIPVILLILKASANKQLRVPNVKNTRGQTVLLHDLENCSGNLQCFFALINKLHFQACSCQVSACWVTTVPHAPIKYLKPMKPTQGGFSFHIWPKTIPDYTSRLLLGMLRHLIMNSVENGTQSRSEEVMTSHWEGQRLAEPERRGRTSGERGKQAAGWHGGRWAFTFISAGAGMSVLAQDVDKAWGEC